MALRVRGNLGGCVSRESLGGKLLDLPALGKLLGSCRRLQEPREESPTRMCARNRE